MVFGIAQATPDTVFFAALLVLLVILLKWKTIIKFLFRVFKKDNFKKETGVKSAQHTRQVFTPSEGKAEKRGQPLTTIPPRIAENGWSSLLSTPLGKELQKPREVSERVHDRLERGRDALQGDLADVKNALQELSARVNELKIVHAKLCQEEELLQHLLQSMEIIGAGHELTEEKR